MLFGDPLSTNEQSFVREVKMSSKHRTADQFKEEARRALVFMIDNSNEEISESSVHDLAILLADVYNRGVDAAISE